MTSNCLKLLSTKEVLFSHNRPVSVICLKISVSLIFQCNNVLQQLTGQIYLMLLYSVKGETKVPIHANLMKPQIIHIESERSQLILHCRSQREGWLTVDKNCIVRNEVALCSHSPCHTHRAECTSGTTLSSLAFGFPYFMEVTNQTALYQRWWCKKKYGTSSLELFTLP